MSVGFRSVSRRRRSRRSDDVTIDPARQSLSHINGTINKMSVREVKRKLTEFNLSTE